MDRHVDVPAVAGHRLVDRVVDDLVDQVVQAARRSCRRCTCPGASGSPRSPRGPGCWPRCRSRAAPSGRCQATSPGAQPRGPRGRYRRSCSDPSRVHLGHSRSSQLASSVSAWRRGPPMVAIPTTRSLDRICRSVSGHRRPGRDRSAVSVARTAAGLGRRPDRVPVRAARWRRRRAAGAGLRSGSGRGRLRRSGRPGTGCRGSASRAPARKACSSSGLRNAASSSSSVGMGHRHVQDPAPHLADPGLAAMRLADRRVPGFLQLPQRPEPPVAPRGEQLAQDVGQRLRSATVRVRHAGLNPIPPEPGEGHPGADLCGPNTPGHASCGTPCSAAPQPGCRDSRGNRP